MLVADLDPQANLTTMFLSDEELEQLWEAENATIHASIQPLLVGTGDATMRVLVEPTVGLSLVPGGLRLSNVVLQHAVRLDRPVQAYARWMARIPSAYRQHVLQEDNAPPTLPAMFALKPADGALGGHTRAVADCYRDFRDLAREIASRCKVAKPSG